MSSGYTFLLAVLAVMIMCVAVSAASRRPGPTWHYYHFDGQGFVAGQPVDDRPFLALRDHALPQVLTRTTTLQTVALPADKGALAGICYIESSGGKLASASGYLPSPGISITISSGQTIVTTVQSDEHGYFVALLPEGSYLLVNGAFRAEAVVERGSTRLVPLRTGRRMVD